MSHTPISLSVAVVGEPTVKDLAKYSHGCGCEIKTHTHWSLNRSKGETVKINSASVPFR